ncbi:peptidase inhibitor family I36 protein [Actinoalloteichus spitiensis]|uniref:peptidase inhibitor family I36 protein n=1 Tax=Actinoalloteichus spitiensis TaxID=252394 RepID=UPI0009FDAC40|nr:peptidase inhibitor family I36 protein [Actinoalloteichus spitiensis]
MRKSARRSLTTTIGVVAVVAGSAVTSGVAAAAPEGAPTVAVSSTSGACEFSGTFCAWDEADFEGTRFTARAWNAGAGACVDLVEHGWGDRIRSAVNTNGQQAVLFEGTDCTGAQLPVLGGSSVSSVEFPANSVLVY